MRVHFLASLVFLMTCSLAFAQSESLQENEKIYAVIQDLQGRKLEGYLPVTLLEVDVTSKEKEEKSFPLKAIESIKLEPVRSGIPGADQIPGEGSYSVRLKDSREVFTLSKKYTLNLQTELGVVVREIDPKAVRDLFQKNPSSPAEPNSRESLVRDKSVIFSIELRF